MFVMIISIIKIFVGRINLENPKGSYVYISIDHRKMFHRINGNHCKGFITIHHNYCHL